MIPLDPAPYTQFVKGHNQRVVRRVPADYDWPGAYPARFAPRTGYSQDPADYPPHISQENT